MVIALCMIVDGIFYFITLMVAIFADNVSQLPLSYGDRAARNAGGGEARNGTESLPQIFFDLPIDKVGRLA